MQKTFAMEALVPIEAKLELAAGTILVEETTEPTIDVSLEPDGRETRRALEAIERATVTFDGRKLTVVVPSRTRSAPLRMRIALPAGSSLDARTASADVELTVPVGDLRVRTASGDVAGSDVTGDAVTITASGDVVVSHVAGRLEARTASGDLRVRPRWRAT